MWYLIVSETWFTTIYNSRQTIWIWNAKFEDEKSLLVGMHFHLRLLYSWNLEMTHMHRALCKVGYLNLITLLKSSSKAIIVFFSNTQESCASLYYREEKGSAPYMNTTTSLRAKPWGVDLNKIDCTNKKPEGWALTKNPHKLELTSPSRDLDRESVGLVHLREITAPPQSMHETRNPRWSSIEDTSIEMVTKYPCP
jgi:hypothetical protein